MPVRSLRVISSVCAPRRFPLVNEQVFFQLLTCIAVYIGKILRIQRFLGIDIAQLRAVSLTVECGGILIGHRLSVVSSLCGSFGSLSGRAL